MRASRHTGEHPATCELHAAAGTKISPRPCARPAHAQQAISRFRAGCRCRAKSSRTRRAQHPAMRRASVRRPRFFPDAPSVRAPQQRAPRAITRSRVQLPANAHRCVPSIRLPVHGPNGEAPMRAAGARLEILALEKRRRRDPRRSRHDAPDAGSTARRGSIAERPASAEQDRATLAPRRPRPNGRTHARRSVRNVALTSKIATSTPGSKLS